jgi:hypothetical protein
MAMRVASAAMKAHLMKPSQAVLPTATVTTLAFTVFLDINRLRVP